MRILLFFDLPMLTSKEQKAYRTFIKIIKKEGFYMLQESVYIKLAINQQVVDSVKNKIKKSLPDNGSIMLLSITEKQFSSIDFMLGENKTDVVNSTDRIIVLWKKLLLNY